MNFQLVERMVMVLLIMTFLIGFTWADKPTVVSESYDEPLRYDQYYSLVADQNGKLTIVLRENKRLVRMIESIGDRDVLARNKLSLMARSLVEGPSAEEAARGFRSALPKGLTIDNVNVKENKADFLLTLTEEYLKDFNADKAQYLADIFMRKDMSLTSDLDRLGLMIKDPADGKYYRMKHFLTDITEDAAKSAELERASDDFMMLRTGQPPAGGQGQPSGFLDGKSIFLSPGHGWYYSSVLGRWATQRGNSYGVIEDHSNAEAVLTYLTKYLWNSGAGVYTVRERDMNENMVIVDNGDAGHSETGSWSTQTVSDSYDGTQRVSQVAYTESATATFTPNIPSAGYYGVYVWYRNHSSGSAYTTTDAKITVNHAGGSTDWTQNQTRDGYTWKYIGTFYFNSGSSASDGSVVISNEGSNTSDYVIADAVRFGGGMGDRVDGGSTSGWPRWEESGKYFAPFMGFNAGTSTVSAMPKYADWESESWEDSAYISWHSNASGGTSRGTISFAYSSSGWGGAFNGITGGDDLRDFVHDEIINDLQAGYEATWTDRGTTTNWYGELNPSYNNEMPAALFEMAFHDNSTDANRLKDPVFRQFCARAVYQGIVKYFADRDSDSYTLLPEPPTNLSVVNDGTGDIELNWDAPPYSSHSGLYGDAATGYKVYRSTDGFAFDNGATVSSGTSYTDTSVTSGQTYYYRVTATNDGGESFPTETMGCRASSGSSDLLVVAGFDRMGAALVVMEDDPYDADDVARGFVDMMNSYRYMIKYGEAIDNYGVPFDSCSNEAVIDNDISLGDYSAVIWFVGEESTADDTFNATEQSRIQTYLTGGGQIFVSGAEIGWDLDYSGGGASFFNNYLKADYNGDDAGTYNVAVSAGGIFAGNSSFSFDDNTYGEYDAQYPDRLSTYGGSSVCLTYSGGSGGNAAIQYDGTFRVVHFGFPYETITTSSARNAVMADVLDFFELGDVEDVILESRDSAGTLESNPPYSESGTWSNSTAKSTAAGLTGTGSRFSGSSTPASDTAGMTPDIQRTGDYNVYATWGTSGNATNVRYIIEHSGGTAYVYKDQEPGNTPGGGNNNQWVLLGQWTFDEGQSSADGSVTVDESTVTGTVTNWNTGRVYSDGFKFEYAD